MKRKSRSILFALAALASCQAFADTQAYSYDDNWYVAPQVAYTWPDSNRHVVNGDGLAFAIGRPVTYAWDAEFTVMDFKLDANDSFSGSAHDTLFGFNWLWLFSGRDKSFAPFADFGIGANVQRADLNNGIPSHDDNTNPYGSVGIGFMLSPWRWDGSLRCDLRALHTFGNGNDTDVVGMVGVMIPF